MEGLFNKYKVIKRSTGKEAQGDYFVLNPAKDPAARDAIRTYAGKTQNRELSRDLVEWMDRIEESEQ